MFFAGFSAHALDKGEQDISGAQSGTYDYLVYAVTWQPTFCMLNKKDSGCKAYRPDFYTHGVWPYFKSSSQTQNKHPSGFIASPGCAENDACDLSKKTLSSMLNDSEYRKIVTSAPEGLMQHEWKKHGTCYGEGQSEYFNEYKKLRRVVKYKNAFKMNIGKNLSMKEIQSWFPSNTSFRCVTVNGKQYLF